MRFELKRLKTHFASLPLSFSASARLAVCNHCVDCEQRQHAISVNVSHRIAGCCRKGSEDVCNCESLQLAFERDEAGASSKVTALDLGGPNAIGRGGLQPLSRVPARR